MGMASAKTRNIAFWTLTSVLALFFLLSGYGKLSNGEASGGLRFDEQFVAWGYPAWFALVVGAAEVAGAVGLFVPRLRFYAAGGLIGLMLGAVGTHLVNLEAIAAPIPLALAGMVAVLAWMSRPAWAQQHLEAAEHALA